MSCHKNNLLNLKECNIKICFANVGSVESSLIGTYKGYINNNYITLNNVLYIPEFKRDLMSIDQLSEDGFKVLFNKNKRNNKKCAVIYDKNEKRIYTSYSTNSNTYKVITKIFKNNYENFKDEVACCSLDVATKNNNLYLWHRRLGHFNIDLIKEKLKNIAIDHKCTIYSIAKLKDINHPRSDSRAKEPFELIHMDLGFAKNCSYQENNYYLVILDDYTRYSWVIFIKNKSDVYDVFIIWFNRVKNIFNKIIKYVRCDNGKEFINNKFINLFNKYGIIFQNTIPYTPQQNGRAERLQDTLKNTKHNKQIIY